MTDDELELPGNTVRAFSELSRTESWRWRVANFVLGVGMGAFNVICPASLQEAAKDDADARSAPPDDLLVPNRRAVWAEEILREHDEETVAAVFELVAEYRAGDVSGRTAAKEAGVKYWRFEEMVQWVEEVESDDA